MFLYAFDLIELNGDDLRLPAKPNMMPIIVPAITATFEIVGRSLVFAEPASHRV
jgi:hypothetical protein